MNRIQYVKQYIIGNFSAAPVRLLLVLLGIVFIKVGTLDDPSWVKPTVHMWCAEKQPWIPLGDEVQQLPAGPGS